MSRAKEIAEQAYENHYSVAPKYRTGQHMQDQVEQAIQQFAREMAEKIQGLGKNFRDHSHDEWTRINEPILARRLREKADSYDNAARIIKEGAGIGGGDER